MISNSQLKKYTTLKEKKCRDREQCFIVEGVRVCEEALNSNFDIEMCLYHRQQLTTSRALQMVDIIKERGLPLEEIDNQALKKLTDTQHPQGIVFIVKKQMLQLSSFIQSTAKLFVAIEAINDPGNLGTIMRTASWFGADGLLLSENSVDYTNPKVVRASMGAIFHFPIFENLALRKTLFDLKNQGYDLILADANGDIAYSEIQYSSKTVLILGGETVSVSDQLKTIVNTSVRIPRAGRGDSLNVSIAAGIILSEIVRRKIVE